MWAAAGRSKFGDPRTPESDKTTWTLKVPFKRDKYPPGEFRAIYLKRFFQAAPRCRKKSCGLAQVFVQCASGCNTRVSFCLFAPGQGQVGNGQEHRVQHSCSKRRPWVDPRPWNARWGGSLCKPVGLGRSFSGTLKRAMQKKRSSFGLC